MDLTEIACHSGTDLGETEQGPVTGSFERNNEPPASTEGQLSEYLLSTKDSPWSQTDEVNRRQSILGLHNKVHCNLN